MDVRNTVAGSLQISTDVVAKIASVAALEVEGVDAVASGGMQSVRGLLSKTSLHKPVNVEIEDGVAMVTLHVVAKYGCLSAKRCRKTSSRPFRTCAASPCPAWT